MEKLNLLVCFSTVYFLKSYFHQENCVQIHQEKMSIFLKEAQNSSFWMVIKLWFFTPSPSGSAAPPVLQMSFRSLYVLHEILSVLWFVGV